MERIEKTRTLFGFSRDQFARGCPLVCTCSTVAFVSLPFSLFSQSFAPSLHPAPDPEHWYGISERRGGRWDVLSLGGGPSSDRNPCNKHESPLLCSSSILLGTLKCRRAIYQKNHFSRHLYTQLQNTPVWRRASG